MATLSSLLVHRGVASMRGVEDAIARQVLQGGDLATNVLEVGAAREDDVTRRAAESLGLPSLPPGRIAPVDPGVLRLLPGEVAQRHGIFPIERRGFDLVVATSEPLPPGVQEDLGFLLNLDLRPVYALRVRIVQALREHYGLPLERRYVRLLSKLDGTRITSEPEAPPEAAAGSAAAAVSAVSAVSAAGGGAASAVSAAGGGAASAVSAAATGSGVSAAGAASPFAPSPSSPTPDVRVEGAAQPAADSPMALMPQRPTLRGMPAVKVQADSWDDVPHADPAAALPATIELSPRPPAAAPQGGAAQAMAQQAAEEAAFLREAQEAVREARAAAEAHEAVRETHEPAAARAAQEGTGPSGAAASQEGVPQALAAWARPAKERSHEGARSGRSVRARRKGPFPAGLAEEEMQSAVTTEAVLEVFFDFAQQFFEYSALFVVHGDIAEGRDAAGRGADRERITAVGLPLDLPSSLASARERRVPVLSDFTGEGIDADFLRDIGRAPATAGAPPSPTAPSQRAAAVVLPIVVRGRAVALLFGDDSPVAVELASIGEVIAFAALAGGSIERIILRRKLGKTGAPAPARLSPGALASLSGRSPAQGAAGSARPATAPPPAASGTAAGVAGSVRAAATTGATALAGASSPTEPAAQGGATAQGAAGIVAASSAATSGRAAPRAGVAALARMFASTKPTAKSRTTPATQAALAAEEAPTAAAPAQRGEEAPTVVAPAHEAASAAALAQRVEDAPTVVAPAHEAASAAALAQRIEDAPTVVASTQQWDDAPTVVAPEDLWDSAISSEELGPEAGSAEPSDASESIAIATATPGLSSDVDARADHAADSFEENAAISSEESAPFASEEESARAAESESAYQSEGERAADASAAEPAHEQPADLAGDASFVEQGATDQLSESSGGALTVAMLLPQDTPPPAEAAPSHEPAEAAREGETQVIPDDALETVEPAPIDSSASVEPAPSDVGAPIESLTAEPGASVELSDALTAEPGASVEPSDALTEEPGASVEPSDALTAEPGASVEPSEAFTAEPGEPSESLTAEPAASAAEAGERPSTSDESRPSAPLVVDIFADSTEGLASAIARAAEVAEARDIARAQRSRPGAMPLTHADEHAARLADAQVSPRADSSPLPRGDAQVSPRAEPSPLPRGAALSGRADASPVPQGEPLKMRRTASDRAIPKPDLPAPQAYGAPQVDRPAPQLDLSPAQLDRVEPQPEPVAPRFERTAPQFVGPHLDRVATQLDRLVPQLDRTPPPFDRVAPEPAAPQPQRVAPEPAAPQPQRAASQRTAPQPRRSPPPDETLTEGFPAVNVDALQLSPDVPALAPFETPPAPDAASASPSEISLDVLLARAVRPEGADARAELKRRAERNLAPLLALFPGPLEQDRHRSTERLPPASQCGPLLAAFAHAGARGAATVAVLARNDDVDVRFWAAHLLGEIASPEAADGLLAFLVDMDAAVRRIAMRSAASILAASLPGRPLEASLGYVARDAHTPLRERLAAIEAMGQLRAPFFVPMLIGLLGAVPEEVGEAARRALLVLTRQDFGRDAGRWGDWWSRNEGRHRIEWLIDALMHETQPLRRAAGDELKSLTKEYFGYYDDLPRRERERAQERYRDWWEREGRARFR
jgi:hypothetical protein